MLICFTSCEKEAYKASDLIPTPTYRIYNPVVTKNVTDDMYEFYVYRQVPMLGIYKSSDYAQCHVEDMRNYVDNSDNEAYKFEFDRIVSVNENGDEVLNHYSIVFCKVRTPIFNQETGVSEYKESTLTVTRITSYNVCYTKLLRLLKVILTSFLRLVMYWLSLRKLM